ncbi:MAG: 2-succinyl-5-enolpyruvyl-6-hydroxy-3-cyclohexene-1-carboxylic-acid synthase, partial [Pricia sp.]|nr:2-succinyl-5-enolpyruvyl-6-hydroxy-3-cyclohexene-1-carboxylic-acid synthase [Pricia sp.]
RSAAFFALGIAQQLREPEAVVCTSGSALLNYYPAVAEAFYSGIPLVVISADRPIYKIDVGDGQTIRQDDVFQRHIGYSANLRQDVIHAKASIEKYIPKWLENDSVESIQHNIQAHNDKELNTALNIAHQVKLPVHINIPFEEPLYNTISKPSINAFLVPIDNGTKDKISNIERFAEIWNNAKRKMVLVGVNPPNVIEQDFLDALAQDPSVIVFTETTSNIHHPNFFPSIDSIIAPIEKSENRETMWDTLQPEILLTFGGLIVSKKIKAFLREYKPKYHWHIDELKAYDTFFALSNHIKTDANSFFTQFIPLVRTIESDYFPFWNVKRRVYETERKKYINKIPFSDMLAFDSIIESIPDGYQVQLANSSTVRYAQLFNMNPTLSVFCNRGTSGIDGSTSTAVGASLYVQNPTVLITGDLSFFYDSNGLWNDYIRPDFRIILINNNGGGIFRILPGREDTANFSTYFETAHHLRAEHLSRQFGFDHELVADEASVKSSLKNFYEASERPKILEIVTPRLMNDKILLAYFDFISSTQY